MSVFKVLKPLFTQIGMQNVSHTVNILFTATHLRTNPIKIASSVRFITQSKVQGIQDNISSLQLKKRTVRKKRALEEEAERPPGLYDTIAYATAEEYNLEALIRGLQEQNLYEPKPIDNNSDVVYAVAKIQVATEPREIFFFREGSVVFWNVTDLESSNVLNFLRQYELDSYTDSLVQNEVEIMNYRHQEQG